jgi:hypothetical protein
MLSPSIGSAAHTVIDTLEEAHIPMVACLFESPTRALLSLLASKHLWRYIDIFINDHEDWAGDLHDFTSVSFDVTSLGRRNSSTAVRAIWPAMALALPGRVALRASVTQTIASNFSSMSSRSLMAQSATEPHQ